MLVGLLTPAVPIFLPPHHLLVFLSSREEGDSLAEAEAAFCTCVMLHLGALRTQSFITHSSDILHLPPSGRHGADLVCLSPPFALANIPMWMHWPLRATEDSNRTGVFQVFRQHVHEAVHLLRHHYSLCPQNLQLQTHVTSMSMSDQSWNWSFVINGTGHVKFMQTNKNKTL